MIPFIKPFFDVEDYQAIKQVLQSGWVAQGPKVEELEEAVAKYLGCLFVISTNNCTTALMLSLMGLGIGPGDEVIVPSFTFPATAIAVTNVGASPVLVDVDMKTYNTTKDLMLNVITKKTKAIIPVHLFGLFCEMDSILDLAEDHDLFVIEDAACSLGTRDFSTSKCAGTFGNVGCFSLHASKGITTGEGGLICTNDFNLANRIRRLSCFGDERAYRRSRSENPTPFYFDPKAGNYKMSDITAALALSQLRKIEMLIDWRIRIAKEWDEIITNDPFLNSVIINKPRIEMARVHIYQSYVAVCKEGERPEVMKYMRGKGFQCGIGTHSVKRYLNLFSWGLGGGVSDYLFDNSISFPRYYGLSPKEEWMKQR